MRDAEAKALVDEHTARLAVNSLELGYKAEDIERLAKQWRDEYRRARHVW
jgi:hypothetical protein